MYTYRIYPKCVKGYKLWCTEAGNHKVVISRDVLFREEEMPYIAQDKGVNDSKGEKDSTRIEVETCRNGRVQEDEEDEQITSDQEENGANDLRDYLLARDRIRRNITPSNRFSNADMIYYALSMAESIKYQEPSNYREAITCVDSEQ